MNSGAQRPAGAPQIVSISDRSGPRSCGSNGGPQTAAWLLQGVSGPIKAGGETIGFDGPSGICPGAAANIGASPICNGTTDICSL
jgi:hypothetical protein